MGKEIRPCISCSFPTAVYLLCVSCLVCVEPKSRSKTVALERHHELTTTAGYNWCAGHLESNNEVDQSLASWLSMLCVLEQRTTSFRLHIRIRIHKHKFCDQL